MCEDGELFECKECLLTVHRSASIDTHSSALGSSNAVANTSHPQNSGKSASTNSSLNTFGPDPGYQSSVNAKSKGRVGPPYIKNNPHHNQYAQYQSWHTWQNPPRYAWQNSQWYAWQNPLRYALQNPANFSQQDYVALNQNRRGHNSRSRGNKKKRGK